MFILFFLLWKCLLFMNCLNFFEKVLIKPVNILYDRTFFKKNNFENCFDFLFSHHVTLFPGTDETTTVCSGPMATICTVSKPIPHLDLSLPSANVADCYYLLPTILSKNAPKRSTGSHTDKRWFSEQVIETLVISRMINHRARAVLMM